MTDVEGDEPASDETLLSIRFGLSARLGALMDAWWLGMVAPREEGDQSLFEEIVADIGEPPPCPTRGEATALGINVGSRANRSGSDEEFDEDGLRRISDEDYLAVFPDLFRRFALLDDAYKQGMIEADGSPEQERALAKIRELLG